MPRTTVSTIAVYGAFKCPSGVAKERVGNAIIVADTGNHGVKKTTTPKHDKVSSLAGTGKEGYRDGEVSVAQFHSPSGVAVDGEGSFIVADTANHRIRKITPQGQVSTLAGTGWGHRDGEGPVALFNEPCGIAVNGDGNLVVADSCNHCIRLVTPQGQVSTLAGTGKKGYKDGNGTDAQFNEPFGVAVETNGNILVSDKLNHCIRKITPQGQVSTMAGSGKKGYQDGEGTDAQFNEPCGVAVDEAGRVVLADRANHRIRLITSQGQVSTLAGTGKGGLLEGEGTEAQFNRPTGLAVDRDGNVIVADTDNHCIRCMAYV